MKRGDLDEYVKKGYEAGRRRSRFARGKGAHDAGFEQQLKLREGSLMTRSWFVVAALAVSAAVVPLTVGAQEPTSSGPPAYRPSLADLMTTTVQPRHVKLAFAGREQNWVFAAYELKQLSDAFDKLSVQWPQWRQQRIVELVETIVRDPLFEMDNAIKDKNEEEFTMSYNHLTEACNACHQAALMTPIVIQDPKESMFPDQDFRPK